MLWFVYRIFTAIAAPFWLAFLSIRQGGRLRERIGLVPRRFDGPVWIQAVSVGEAKLASRLGAILRPRGIPIFLTSTTSTGLGLLEREELGPRAFPADLPFAAAIALGRVKPACIVLVETELWPGFLRQAARRGIPVVIVNARISDRSLKRTLAFKGLFGHGLENVHVAAQSEEQAGRFERLGVSQRQITVAGNMKYDLEPPATFLKQQLALKRLIPEPAGRIWVAGSVREGEERLVAEAHYRLMKEVPSARLIVAPRHLGRAAVAMEEAKRLGLNCVRRTNEPEGAWSVMILDTIGELWAAYSLGEAAFVGGSLVALGGQNPVEPAFLGKPVLFGPSMENFREPAEMLLAVRAALRVEGPEALAFGLKQILLDEGRREEMGRAAASAVASSRGATERTAEAVLARLKR